MATVCEQDMNDMSASMRQPAQCHDSAGHSYKSHQSAAIGDEEYEGDEDSNDGISDGAREYEEMMADFEQQDLEKEGDGIEVDEDVPFRSSQAFPSTLDTRNWTPTPPPQAPPPSPTKATIDSPPESRLPPPIVGIPKGSKRKIDTDEYTSELQHRLSDLDQKNDKGFELRLEATERSKLRHRIKRRKRHTMAQGEQDEENNLLLCDEQAFQKAMKDYQRVCLL